MTKPFLAFIVLACCASRLWAQENIIGAWPVGGGPITVSPIDGSYSTGGFEFVATGDLLTVGTSPAPFEFFIPRDENPRSSVVISNLNLSDLVTIDGPITLDIYVSPLATSSDVVAFCSDHTTCAFPVRMVPEPNAVSWWLLLVIGVPQLHRRRDGV